MSIWTQVFVINLIIFWSITLADRALFNDSIKKYLFHGKTVLLSYPVAFWTVGTVVSFPAWLIYLVITA